MGNNNSKDTQSPKHTCVKTVVTPQDLEPVKANKNGDGVSWEELEDAVVVTNPDVNTLDRG